MPGAVYNSEATLATPRFGWRDIVLFGGFFGLLYVVVHAAHAMHAPYAASQPMYINLSPRALPGYAARSVLRMFIAFGASLLFTFAYGYAAAHNKRWEKVLIPLLDILQSVPVLSFLAATVTIFIELFPGSVLGLECASIFAIFTSQAWNMTFSFYNSLRMVPQDLNEAAVVYRLTQWQKFVKLEVPFSMLGLVWNSMMSFGGGWFFLAASEAITVLNHQVLLPGIGSYMQVAHDRGDTKAVIWAIGTMVVVVVLVDQLFWRPVVAWSQKFKFEQTETADAPTSVVLDVIQHSALIVWIERRLLPRLVRRMRRGLGRARRRGVALKVHAPMVPPKARTFVGAAFEWGLAALALYGLFLGVREVGDSMSWRDVLQVFSLGCLTMGRVVVMVVVATLVWTPVGVYIGLSPRLARIAQPLVQIGASFPANLLFPVVVVAFIRYHINLNWGSILLLALGTQWYIVFNVIAGAAALPSDLREAAQVFHLTGWSFWRKLILPGIFSFWVTGALTAAGGAWNASIVAEVASWGTHKLEAQGLGAYIADATAVGDWPRIILGTAVLSIFVVAFNRLLWRRLYALAERKYRLD